MPSADSPVPEPPRGRRLRARDAIVVVVLAVVLLVLFEGASIREAGEEMQPGLERRVVLAVGHPAGWVADQLPFDEAADDALAWIEDDDLPRGSGFDAPAQEARRGGGVPPVDPAAFDPAELGERPRSKPRLKTLLVTGDSLAIPLDVEIARRLADERGVDVVRDPHIGTGVSKSGFVDWGRLSAQQVRDDSPDAVVVFIGANEGFPLPAAGGGQVDCCGPRWAAGYAFRVRRMMDTWRRRGAARVYWLTLPLPRDRSRQEISRAVNAAIEVAAQPYRAQVRVIDLVDVFTPDGYRDAMPVDGRDRIVREGDGIHLNATGARVAAPIVIDAVRRDFGR